MSTYLDETDPRAFNYLKKTLAELERITKPGDVLSVGSVVSFIAPPSAPVSERIDTSPRIDPAHYGFRLLAEKEDHECLWVRE